MDDVWVPERARKKAKRSKYKVTCRCGNEMRVRRKHFGRLCRCTQCRYPIYVTPDIVSPPFDPSDDDAPRIFTIDNVPAQWRKGDLLVEMYEVLETLGEGGMGIVYKVHHRGWGVPVAVKSPLERFLTKRGWVDTFEHECETWINLSPHPNTVKCYYFRRLGGIPRVFVEFVDGQDLFHLINEKQLYEGGHDAALVRMLDIAIQFAWGLGHAHGEGLIHQDVKPGNVLVTENGLVKVTDFGMARVQLEEVEESGNGGKARFSGPRGGTAIYRSPDHRLQDEVTYKTDLWSWGLSLVEMFAGKIFWADGNDALNALNQLVRGDYDRGEAPEVPRGIEALLSRCFERDPENRPDNMRAVADALLEVYEDVVGRPYGRHEPEAGQTTSDMLNNRAVSLLDLGKPAESVSLWTRVLESDPKHLEAGYNLSLHRWRSGRLTDVDFIERLKTMRQGRADSSLAPCLLARVLMERGDCAEAIKVLEKLTESGEGYHREAAVALAMAQNEKDRDRKLIWNIFVHSTPVTAVCISFDGWRAVAGCAEGLIRMWEMSFGKCTALFEGHTGRVTSVCLSGNEKRVLSSSDDGTLKVWDPVLIECERTLTGHVGKVLAAALTRDGALAVSAGEDHTVKLWDVDTGRCIRTLEGHRAAVNSVAINKEGSVVVSGGDDHIVAVWDAGAGECLNAFRGNSKRVTSVSVCGERSIAVSGSGPKVKIWDLDAGRRIRSFLAHTSDVHSVCLSGDGRYVVSATRLGTAKVWDVDTGQCLRSFRSKAPVSMSSDGRYIISGRTDGRFKVWTMNCDEAPLAAPFMICQDADAQMLPDRPATLSPESL